MSKPKKCRNCRESFLPVRSLQIVCSATCAIEHQAKKNAQERKSLEQIGRREIKAKKEALKGVSHYLQILQGLVNQCVRLRDKDEPCISCGRHHGGQYHAGHYRTVKACSALRFNLLNIHKQCSACNTHLSGNIVEYRINLVKKIGAEQVEWLEGPQPTIRYEIDWLKEQIAHYRALVRQMKRDAA